THWVTTTNFMGCLPFPRFRAYLGASKALLGALATSFALLRIPKMRREDEAFTLLKRNPQALEQISQLCAVAPSPDEDLNLTAARADGRVDRDRKIWGELDVMHKNIAKAPALSPQ